MKEDLINIGRFIKQHYSKFQKYYHSINENDLICKVVKLHLADQYASCAEIDYKANELKNKALLNISRTIIIALLISAIAFLIKIIIERMHL